jgi:glucokinase
MTLAIGVVIAQSATRFSASAMGLPARRVWRRREETPLSPREASAVIEQFTTELRAETGAQNVAICCALDADLDAARERVIALRYAPGWAGAAFRALLAERLTGVVSLATLTEAAAVAEVEQGAGRGQRAMLYILPARGVTACFIEKGMVIRGAHGVAGALDHWPARADGPHCACGGHGHLGALASSQSIVRAMIGRAADSDESTAAMLRVSEGRAEAMTAPQVVELAAQGDPAAQMVIADATDALACALAPIALMLDPGIIVIGGQLAAAQDYYFRALNERLHAFAAGGAHPPQVVPGLLEPVAALTGAGILASQLRN